MPLIRRLLVVMCAVYNVAVSSRFFWRAIADLLTECGLIANGPNALRPHDETVTDPGRGRVRAVPGPAAVAIALVHNGCPKRLSHDALIGLINMQINLCVRQWFGRVDGYVRTSASWCDMKRCLCDARPATDVSSAQPGPWLNADVISSVNERWRCYSRDGVILITSSVFTRRLVHVGDV